MATLGDAGRGFTRSSRGHSFNIGVHKSPPGRLNLRIHLFPASSIPGPFIQTPPPLHPPRPQQLFPRLDFCFVIRFLLVILSPKLLGQRYLRSSISHKPAICLGELSRCLISFIISRLERPLPSAIPRNVRHHYSQLTTLSSPCPDAFSFSPR